MFEFPHRYGTWQLTLSLFLIAATVSSAQQLSWKSNDQGFELIEAGKTRLFYQTATKDKDGKYPRANYIHPLYDLNGEVITEDFPDDHLHHRGIFWTWHQLYVDGKRVADPWVSEGISWNVQQVTPQVIDEEQALLEAVITWQVNGQEVVEELLHMHYERVDPELYKLTIDIQLKPLAKNVQIGGSEDPKGYGGFSPRIKLSETTGFYDQHGAVVPNELPVAAGPWMNITRQGPEDPGVVILGEPEKLPSYQGWILRKKNSMQNMAFPGREPLTLPEKEPYLHFRNQLLVHLGLQTAEIDLFHQDFVRERNPSGQALVD
ncbi:MAG: PmoA family protein [Lunatimonas sp.]|uniref:DUF6807 family protein n=1 Tax=Lunatimonas sp. TaxID=2060141 RepID=UPI00263A722F|nr:DUF6807 family protein [Lunatimonas sp.]MCC5939279.1 PmoA family protein [Lunatimonas sp.]